MYAENIRRHFLIYIYIYIFIYIYIYIYIYRWFSLTSYQNSEAVNNRFRFQNVCGIVKDLKLHFWAKFCSGVIGK